MNPGPPFGCIAIPHLPIAIERAARQGLVGAPLAIAHPGDTAVWVVSAEAADSGVAPGQSVREALAICPGLQVIEARTAQYAGVMQGIVARVHTIVFGVEPGEIEEGVIHLDLTGLERHHASAAALSEALLRCVPRDLQPRLGLAATKFAARVAAAGAKPLSTVTVEGQDVAAFLGPHPIELLPVSSETIRRLHLLGLHTLAQVARLPRPAVIAAFGSGEGDRIWRLASGNDAAAVHAHFPDEHIDEQISLETPIVTREPLVAAIEQITNRLCRSPAFSGRSTRRANIRLITDRADCKEFTVNFHEPVTDAHRLRTLIGSALHDIQLPGAVIEVHLELCGIAAAQGWQRSFSHTQGGRQELLEEGLRKLVSQYGRCPVSRVIAMDPDSRIPEDRWALIDCNP